MSVYIAKICQGQYVHIQSSTTPLIPVSLEWIILPVPEELANVLPAPPLRVACAAVSSTDPDRSTFYGRSQDWTSLDPFRPPWIEMFNKHFIAPHKHSCLASLVFGQSSGNSYIDMSVFFSRGPTLQSQWATLLGFNGANQLEDSKRALLGYSNCWMNWDASFFLKSRHV